MKTSVQTKQIHSGIRRHGAPHSEWNCSCQLFSRCVKCIPLIVTQGNSARKAKRFEFKLVKSHIFALASFYSMRPTRPRLTRSQVVPQSPSTVQKAAHRQQSSAARRPQCTHMAMNRLYGEHHCHMCGKVPSLGWVYSCEQSLKHHVSWLTMIIQANKTDYYSIITSPGTLKLFLWYV